MSEYWAAETAKFRLTGREGDPVLVDAPAHSLAAPYNGQTGQITGFHCDDWILASIGGTDLRFRADELKLL